MAIPEPIETFLLRLGFDYTPLHAGGSAASGRDPAAQRDWTITRVFVGGDTPILAMCAAGRRIQLERLRQLAKMPQMHEATASELAQLYPFAEPGTAPPLGPLYAQQVFVDEELTHHSQVVFSAGTNTDAVRMRYGDFAELVHPIVGSFTEPEGRTPTLIR